MRKHLWVLLLAAGSASAQIPVTDGIHIGTSISNQIETISQWASQYAQMVESIEKLETQIKKAKEHYSAITGARGMGTLLDKSQALTTALPADWQDVLSNIQSSASYKAIRKSYPTFKDNPKANALYDAIASHDASTSDLYGKANSQVKEIQKLLLYVDAASDPAAKMDLMNRIAIQQSGLQAHRNLLALVEQKQKQELEAASAALARDYACKQFKRKDCSGG